MPEYKSPGVYTEEFGTGRVPIAGVDTSTAGFIGPTERGPINPQRITSLSDYRRTFGDVASATFQGIENPQTSYLMYAVDGFFSNGGSECYVARVTAEDAVRATAELDGVTIRAVGPGAWGNNVQVAVEEATLSQRFNLVVNYWKQSIPDDTEANQPDNQERYNDLSVSKDSPDYYVRTVNNASEFIEINEGATEPLPASEVSLEGGDNGGDLGVDDFKGRNTRIPTPSGDPDENQIQRTGLEGFSKVDPIAIVNIPDENKLDGLTRSLIEHCEGMEDRFAILQTQQGVAPDDLFNQVTQGALSNIVSDRGYAALYYPWIKVLDPITNIETLVPPGGHIAGVYARSDMERGVHKVPANEQLRGTQGLEHEIRKEDQDSLNPLGINCILIFPGRGIRVWGARTTSPDPRWKYVNVRRLFLFLKESIDEGTQWAVFEPNDEPLWARVRQSVSNFLTVQWRKGAFIGTTPDEAFFVKCDRTTMTQDDIDNGRLICVIGVAPAKPAEFVMFKITHRTAGAEETRGEDRSLRRKRVSSGTEWESRVGYSRAVQAGSEVHVSGTTATDDDGNVIGKDDPYEQARQALRKIERSLDETDASFDDVVRTRIFVTDIDEWEAIGDAHEEVFGNIQPATSMIEVNRLINPDLLVEIEAVAIVSD
jgi:phage tail sheath protein FI